MSGERLRPGWILGPWADLLIFTGPIALGLVLIGAGAWLGILHEPLPAWAFAALIIGCDVAHVYATGFRVYLDPAELRRRPGLYLGVPIACLAVGILLHGHSPPLFWRTLAYLAAFHFVRQQWGWVAYCRRRAGEAGRLDRLLDQIAIYNATLFPLLWWHAHLPRAFVWFLEGDFAPGLPPFAAEAGLYLHWSLNALYLARQLQRGLAGRGVNWAKLQVWVTTWCAWYGGIVLLDSDLAFTALNVLSHGIPYLAVVYRVERLRWDGAAGLLAAVFAPRRWLLFLALLAAAGYGEEWLWDRLVWHDHDGLFPGAGWSPGAALLTVLVPLLALPQAVHYVLDGWIWRTRSYRDLRPLFAERGLSPSSPPPDTAGGPA